MRIFHRIDDVTICSREMSYVLDFFAESVREFVVAAIPHGLTKAMASRICQYTNCCVYQHGYQHVNRVLTGWCDEFPDSFLHTKHFIKMGKHRLEDLLQRMITGYVPPWNNTGVKTIQILGELGFRVYSAQKNHTMPFRINRDITVDVVASYKPRITYKSFEDVIDEVKGLSSTDEEIGILYHFKNVSADDLSKIVRFAKEVESMRAEKAVGGSLR